jgi:hypothetical protein
MSDHEDDLVKAAKESHAAIDDAVREHLGNVGITGIGTGWILVVAVTDFDDGDELDGMLSTNSDGLSKWSKIGLLSTALHQEQIEGYL